MAKCSRKKRFSQRCKIKYNKRRRRRLKFIRLISYEINSIIVTAALLGGGEDSSNYNYRLYTLVSRTDQIDSVENSPCPGRISIFHRDGRSDSAEKVNSKLTLSTRVTRVDRNTCIPADTFT